MPLLQVNGLSTSYEGGSVLNDISFSLDDGEILCLLGPSGSGKTTLLRQLAGLDPAEKGSILFAGQDMSKTPPYKRNFGMMFQEYALFPHKNVAENIRFGLEMQQWSEGKKQKRVEEMLELVGLHGFNYRSVDELSGGERQRVALARSLAPHPQLLLLDEPLGSLDRILRDRLAGEIRSILKTQGITAIFVTHDQSEAFAVADKIAILHQGKLEQFGTPEKVYRTPSTIAAARFLGFNNIFDFTDPELPDIDSLLTNLPIKFQQKKNKLLLIRPEAATLSTDSDELQDYPRLKGCIEKLQFQGNSYQLVIRVEKLQFSFILPIDPSPPEKGEILNLAINPRAMIHLKRKND